MFKYERPGRPTLTLLRGAIFSNLYLLTPNKNEVDFLPKSRVISICDDIHKIAGISIIEDDFVKQEGKTFIRFSNGVPGNIEFRVKGNPQIIDGMDIILENPGDMIIINPQDPIRKRTITRLFLDSPDINPNDYENLIDIESNKSKLLLRPSHPLLRRS